MTAKADTISAAAGLATAAMIAGQQRAADEDQLDHRRVQRVGGLVQVRLEQVGPHRAQHRRGRRDREPADEAAHQQDDGGRAELREGDDRAERDSAWTIATGSSTRRAPIRSTSRPWTGAPSAEPSAKRPRHRARDRERAGLLAQVEDDRQRVDADRQPREQRRGDERGHVRRAQDLEVAPHAPQASAFACSSTSSSIVGVSLPGERVLLARVKAAEQRPRLAVGHRAVAELRLRPRRPARR